MTTKNRATAADWKAANHEILSRLDLRAELTELGVRVAADRPRPSGWLEVHAVGRDDNHPSAAVCVQGEKIGCYSDRKTGEKISFWELAVRRGRFNDWRQARGHYAQKAGVQLPAAAGKAAATITEAACNDRDGETTDEVVRCDCDQETSKSKRTVASKETLLKKLDPLPDAAEIVHVRRWLATKPGVTIEQVRRARGVACRWTPQQAVCACLPAIDPASRKLCGVAIYKVDGTNFEIPGMKPHKIHVVGGSIDGLIVVGSLEELAAAAVIVKCEGPSDALALAAHLPSGYLAVTNSHGAASFPDDLALPMAEKDVWVVHDADQAGESGAVSAVIPAAIRAGAKSVRHVRLPYDVSDSHGKDIRDWLNEGHTFDELAALAAKAEPVAAGGESEAAAAESEEEDDPGIIKRLADAIATDNHFAVDAGDRLYRYEGGVYRPKADAYVRRQVKRLLEQWQESARWSSKRADEVVTYIATDAPQLLERPPDSTVNVKNGLLDLRTGTLGEHSPGFLSPVQIPVEFNPAADCPAIRKFVDEVFPPDATDLAWEVAGWLMVPDTSIQKAVLLMGEGGNGKSRYLAMIREFIGRGNATALPLHRLEDNQYAAARLVGKLANICPDLPSTDLKTTSVFKAITGGDPIIGENKFATSFDFTPFVRLVFSANHPPRSNDSSGGFFRRWLCIPFERTFDGEREMVPPDELDARLSKPTELSGLLNLAIEGWRRLKANRGFREPESIGRAGEDFRQATDHFSIWLEKHTIEGPDCCVTCDSLAAAYNEAASNEGRTVKTKKAIGQCLRKSRPHLPENRQVTIAGKKQWCYVGIGLKTPGSQPNTGDPPADDGSREAHDSLDSPYLNKTRTGAVKLWEGQKIIHGRQRQENIMGGQSSEPCDSREEVGYA